MVGLFTLKLPYPLNTQKIKNEVLQPHYDVLFRRGSKYYKNGTSFILSSIMAVLLFSGMQMYKSWLSASQVHTILGGYIGSIFFLLILTAIGNIESTLFGKAFQLKYPEISLCLLISIVAAGAVHRVCATTCFIFSLVALYYLNKISQKAYAVPAQQTIQSKKKSHKS